jgi:hypothetical protein
MARKTIARKDRSSRRTTAAKSGHETTATKAVTAAFIERSIRRMDDAVTSIRLARSALGECEGGDMASITDVRRSVARAVDDVCTAADWLIKVSSAQDSLDRFYDSMDVLLVAQAALGLDELPRGHGITTSPTAGALGVAAAGLQSVRDAISCVRGRRVNA